MAQISKGDTFANGEQVTGARLNQLVDSATVLSGAITEQGALTANTVAANDSFLMFDQSANALRKPTASDILNSNLPITTSSISGNGSADIVLTPPAGQKFDVAGALESESSNVVGNETVGGNLSVGGTLSVVGAINGTSAIKIATGTTAERPVSPVAGQLRFNTTSNALEVYSGSTWINGVTSGSALFDGTVNITGAIQYNGTPVYGLYGTERFTYAGTTWSSLTKPSDEIWVVHLSSQIGVGSTDGSQFTPVIFIPPSTYIKGSAYECFFIPAFGGDYQCCVNGTLVIPAGTSFTAKAIEVGVGNPVSGGHSFTYGTTYTISKYKTA